MFAGAYSEGFDPDRDLQRIGVANQTTMLRGETQAVQRLLQDAIRDRDHGDLSNFRFFDTICGATQERQDALFEMLHRPPAVLLVVGGYNSSNTAHLVEIGEKSGPTFFVRDHHCLLSSTQIRHFSLHKKQEIISQHWLPSGPCEIGVTAGASCPNNLIEDVIQRIFALADQ
jgi:4-hydroxy-3-methylbut-2-enyl diphosphate reductase